MKDDYTLAAMSPPQSPPLQNAIADSLERLRADRMNAFADGKADISADATQLESSVDAFLEQYSDLQELHDLAMRVAGGEKLNVDADRMLVTRHATTFQRIVERYRAMAGNAPVMTEFLPAVPMLIE